MSFSSAAVRLIQSSTTGFLHQEVVPVPQREAIPRWLDCFKESGCQEARWQEVLAEYDLKIIHRPGSQHLSRIPIREPHPCPMYELQVVNAITTASKTRNPTNKHNGWDVHGSTNCLWDFGKNGVPLVAQLRPKTTEGRQRNRQYVPMFHKKNKNCTASSSKTVSSSQTGQRSGGERH